MSEPPQLSVDIADNNIKNPSENAMSTPIIPPLQPASSVNAIPTTTAPHASTQTITPLPESGTVVELSTLARIQNLLQTDAQAQLGLANQSATTAEINAQTNALQQLNNIALAALAYNTSTNTQTTQPQATTALQNTSDAVLNSQVQTSLTSEALLSAIAAENVNSVAAEINQAQLLPSISPSVNVSSLGNAQVQQAPATIDPTIGVPATLTVTPALYATTMSNNPAISAAIAAYHLSDGMIAHASDPVSRKRQDETLMVKGISIVDATEKMKEDDAQSRAARERPSLWKRVMHLKNKFLQRFPNQKKKKRIAKQP